MKKLISFSKNLLFILRVGNLLKWLSFPLVFFGNFLAVSLFISSHKNKGIINDTFTMKRDFDRRFKLFGAISDHFNLNSKAINYLEFGVATGTTLRWWLTNNTNPDSRFYGFDTFEGLPEDWGGYRQGDMNFNIPDITDPRAQLLKNLFQKSLPPFVKEADFQKVVTVIHLDADLFSSTLFVLCTLDPFLKSGDIIFFDEFNVPNHEYLAFKEYTTAYYRDLEFIGAVNNCYQVAFKVV